MADLAGPAPLSPTAIHCDAVMYRSKTCSPLLPAEDVLAADCREEFALAQEEFEALSPVDGRRMGFFSAGIPAQHLPPGHL